ncbi:MAG TPA: glycosyltransferase family 4 protein [Candidatus Binataceae bacterium]
MDDFSAHQEQECQKFGVRPTINGTRRRRILDEYREATLIRVNSEHSRRTFLDRGFSPESIVTILPHLNVAEFPQAEFKESTFRIAFVGLLEPWKGFHYLVDAYLKLGLPDSELVFWGGTSSRPVARYFAEAIAKNPSISLRPQMIRAAGLENVYGRASVLVHPSLTEGFGYVVAEAMACGIPVITTYNTGAAELIRDGENGYLVPPGDSSALADRILHLHRNPALLPVIGARARCTIASAMTLEGFRSKYVPHLMGLLN